MVDDLYKKYYSKYPKASSIEVAKAAKVIESTLCDLNITLNNESAAIFNRLGIDTEAVIQAACGKWSFLPFRPGLVVGHSIGVDIYYLTHKGEWIGYHPQTDYLTERTIEENKAFVVPKESIDPRRVRQTALEAQMIKLIESWPEKYKTFVEEQGLRLSGGQRLRIGIASALYKRADVIFSMKPQAASTTKQNKLS